MTFRMFGDTANKLALALTCFSCRLFFSFLASWYVYSVATGFYNCARRWDNFCYAMPVAAPAFIITVATDSEGGDPRLTDILWLSLIVTVLWTAVVFVRRYRSS